MRRQKSIRPAARLNAPTSPSSATCASSRLPTRWPTCRSSSTASASTTTSAVPTAPSAAKPPVRLQHQGQSHAHRHPAPTHYRVRRDRIDSHGSVTLRYLGRLRHIRVGARHRNRHVLLLVAGAEVRVVTTAGELLRELQRDPDRVYFALEGRWPVHNVLRQVSSCLETGHGAPRGIRTPDHLLRRQELFH